MQSKEDFLERYCELAEVVKKVFGALNMPKIKSATRTANSFIDYRFSSHLKINEARREKGGN